MIQMNQQNLVLSGGEDYQLLFTVSKKDESLFQRKMKQKGFKFYKIGCVTGQKKSLKVFNQSGDLIILKNKGYDHFKK